MYHVQCPISVSVAFVKSQNWFSQLQDTFFSAVIYEVRKQSRPQASRHLVRQTHRLHSHILSKSPGPQPPSHLPPRGITGMGSPCGRRNTRWEHSPSSLEAPSRGRGGRCCPTARLSIGGGAVAQPWLWPTPDHRGHTCPSSVHARVHSYCTPAPRSLPTPPRLRQLIGGGGEAEGVWGWGQLLVLNVLTISGRKGILVTNERYSEHASGLPDTVWLLWIQ